MRALVSILPLLGACALYSSDGYDGPIGSDGDHCLDLDDYHRYTGEIFEPKDGETVDAMFTVRAKWNDPETPDGYVKLYDADNMDNDYAFYGHDFTKNADGSESESYDLSPGMDLVYEIGWFCDDGNDFTDVILDRVHFFTQ